MNRGLATAVVALFLVSSAAACGGTASSTATAGPTAPPKLTAGQHTSTVFQPTVTFTVPDGWTNPVDDISYFELAPSLDQVNGIHLFHDWSALSQAADCPYRPEPGVGTSASDIVTWMRSLKGLSVTPPAMVTVGGRPATMVNLSIAPNWKQSCSFANGLPTVPLLVDQTQQLHWVVAGSETLRLYVLDLPAGGTLIVDLDSFDGVGFPSLLTTAAPIVQSLSFAGQ